MRRVLFVAEDLSRAQVVRSAVLARSLDPSRYQVHMACGELDDMVFRPGEFCHWSMATVARKVARAAVRRGKRLYDVQTLRGYVQRDLEIIEGVEPDLVVGDFRWSLGISTALTRVPYAALVNAYWSPYAVREEFPLPDHPIINVVGERMAGRYFPQVVPRILGHFAEPVNTVRKEHGLEPLEDLLAVLTHGDHTLYPDAPALVPTRDAPAAHRYIGPVLWQPEVSLPPWWQELVDGKPLIYVTLGSSGRLSALPAVLEALADLPVVVVVATAGRTRLAGVPAARAANVRVLDYVPGRQVCMRADLVVCHGGPSTAYQALSQGTPVLGVASNLDQHLAMSGICARGAGVRLRAMNLRAKVVRRAVTSMLGASSYRRRAAELAAELTGWDPQVLFPRFVAEVLGQGDVNQGNQRRGFCT